MKKMLAALALALTLPTCALGDSEGVIVQSSCNIVQSGDYYLAYCFAQVHNNASTVICLDQGTFDLQSGETLLSTQRGFADLALFPQPRRGRLSVRHRFF